MSNSEEYYLVRKDTSEIVDESNVDEVFVKLRAGDVVLRKEGLEERTKLVSINMRFGKVNLNVLWDICRKYPIFFKMIEYLQYQSGKLTFSNGREINRRNLCELCNLSHNTVDRQIKGLIEEDIIKTVKNGRSIIFYVNPYVVHIGSTVYESLRDMFKDSIYKKNCAKLTKGDKNERL